MRLLQASKCKTNVYAMEGKFRLSLSKLKFGVNFSKILDKKNPRSHMQHKNSKQNLSAVVLVYGNDWQWKSYQATKVALTVVKLMYSFIEPYAVVLIFSLDRADPFITLVNPLSVIVALI